MVQRRTITTKGVLCSNPHACAQTAVRKRDARQMRMTDKDTGHRTLQPTSHRERPRVSACTAAHWYLSHKALENGLMCPVFVSRPGQRAAAALHRSRLLLWKIRKQRCVSSIVERLRFSLAFLKRRETFCWQSSTIALWDSCVRMASEAKSASRPVTAAQKTKPFHHLVGLVVVCHRLDFSFFGSHIFLLVHVVSDLCVC